MQVRAAGKPGLLSYSCNGLLGFLKQPADFLNSCIQYDVHYRMQSVLLVYSANINRGHAQLIGNLIQTEIRVVVPARNLLVDLTNEITMLNTFLVQEVAADFLKIVGELNS
ncbi:hypothetical protein D3C81_1629190 [compost metagenome]